MGAQSAVIIKIGHKLLDHDCKTSDVVQVDFGLAGVSPGCGDRIVNRRRSADAET